MRILLCERCYAPVDASTTSAASGGADPTYYTLAHIDRVEPDGTVRFVHSAVHVAPCGEPAHLRSAAEPPNVGEWNRARRSHSPAAAAWIARRPSAERVAGA